jgi:hypothetical protein
MQLITPQAGPPGAPMPALLTKMSSQLMSIDDLGNRGAALARPRP